MAVVKNRSTPENCEFWDHVESIAKQVRARRDGQVSEIPTGSTASSMELEMRQLRLFLAQAEARVEHLEQELQKRPLTLTAFKEVVAAVEERDANIADLERQLREQFDAASKFAGAVVRLTDERDALKGLLEAAKTIIEFVSHLSAETFSPWHSALLMSRKWIDASRTQKG